MDLPLYNNANHNTVPTNISKNQQYLLKRSFISLDWATQISQYNYYILNSNYIQTLYSTIMFQ